MTNGVEEEEEEERHKMQIRSLSSRRPTRQDVRRKNTPTTHALKRNRIEVNVQPNKAKKNESTPTD